MAESGVDLSFDDRKGKPSSSLLYDLFNDGNVTMNKANPERLVIIRSKAAPRSNDMRKTARSQMLRTNQKQLLMKQQQEQQQSRKPMFSQSVAAKSLPLSNFRTEVEVSTASAPLSAMDTLDNERFSDFTDFRSPVSYSTTNSVSESDDFLTDLASLESYDGDEFSSIDFNLLPLHDAISESVHDSVFFKQEPQSSDITSSSSCPALLLEPGLPVARGGRQKDLPPPNMTAEERKIWERERQKKDLHNQIEKRRRYNINDRIKDIATLLPKSYDLDLQNKKGTILQSAVDYIQKLKKDQERMSTMEDKLRNMELMNRKLMLRINSMQVALSQQQQQQQQQQLPTMVHPAVRNITTQPNQLNNVSEELYGTIVDMECNSEPVADPLLSIHPDPMTANDDFSSLFN